MQEELVDSDVLLIPLNGGAIKLAFKHLMNVYEKNGFYADPSVAQAVAENHFKGQSAPGEVVAGPAYFEDAGESEHAMHGIYRFLGTVTSQDLAPAPTPEDRPPA